MSLYTLHVSQHNKDEIHAKKLIIQMQISFNFLRLNIAHNMVSAVPGESKIYNNSLQNYIDTTILQYLDHCYTGSLSCRNHMPQGHPTSSTIIAHDKHMNISSRVLELFTVANTSLLHKSPKDSVHSTNQMHRMSNVGYENRAKLTVGNMLH